MTNTKIIIGSIVENKNDKRKGIITDISAGDEHNKVFIELSENGDGVFVAPSTLVRYWKITSDIDENSKIDDVAVTNDDEGAKLDAEIEALNAKPEITELVESDKSLDEVIENVNTTVVDEHIDAEIKKVENEIAPNDSTVVIKHDDVKPEIKKEIVKPVKKVKTPLDTKLFDKVIAAFDFPNVSTRKTGSYTGLLIGKKLFAEVHINKKMTFAMISSKCLTDAELVGIKLSPEKYKWRINAYIVINSGNFNKAIALIKKAYNATKLEIENKKAEIKVIEK